MSSLLQTINLSFAYDKADAIKGVNLRLFAGEMIALIGPNGSGKSTLIKTLIGALHATAGEIHWSERPMAAWSRRELARIVAYLAQSPMFDPEQTVLETLRLGRAPYWHLFGLESPRDMQVVHEVATKLRLTDLLHRRLHQLSGGQRQRVFVGRSLVQEPRAILLDEPSTFLDLKHQVELITLLKRVAKDQNVGILMASHDLNLAAASADHLILLDRGVVVADGKPEQVLDPELIARVYDVPMERLTREGNPPVLIPRL